jgi:hypothetical protein
MISSQLSNITNRKQKQTSAKQNKIPTKIYSTNEYYRQFITRSVTVIIPVNVRHLLFTSSFQFYGRLPSTGLATRKKDLSVSYGRLPSIGLATRKKDLSVYYGRLPSNGLATRKKDLSEYYGHIARKKKKRPVTILRAPT